MAARFATVSVIMWVWLSVPAGDVVKVSTLDSGYYASEYFAGIRVYS